MATIGKHKKIIFSESDIQFIKDNFYKITNQQLADALGLKKTIVKRKAYSLGLKRIDMEFWAKEAVTFLKENYHKIGDRELVQIFTKRFPKQKGWKPSHIQKKMLQLGLKRNNLDWWVIKERNRNRGSFGNKNEKNISQPPIIFFNLNPKTRIQIKPGQSILELKQKYQKNDTTI